MTVRDNRDYIRVLLYSYYTTITGWGVLLNETYADSLVLERGCCFRQHPCCADFGLCDDPVDQ